MANTRLVIATLLFGAFGCSASPSSPPANERPATGAKPAGTGRAKLWLSAVQGQDVVTLDVNYEKGETAAPRVADIRIAHSEALTLKGATAGEGATSVGKELTTQEPVPNVIRLILLSKDTRELKSGVLAQIKLAKTGSGESKLDILMDKPVFAPAEAMQGLVIGEPLKM
jgi:hypothetical protein